MKKFLADLIKRLSSRKFLLALAAAATLAAEQQWAEMVAVVIAYISAEGIADTAERYQEEKTQQAQLKFETVQTEFGAFDNSGDGSVNKGTILPGNAEAIDTQQ